MTKIYTKSFHTPLYKSAVTPTEKVNGKLEDVSSVNINPITLWWNVTQDYFEIKAIYLEETSLNPDGSFSENLLYVQKPFFWHKINITALKSKTGFTDHTMWSVKYSDLYHQFSITTDGVTSAADIDAVQINDVFSETLLNKSNYATKETALNTLYQIFVPYSNNSDMTSFTYRMMLDEYNYGGSTIPYVIDPTASPAADNTPNAVRDLIQPITFSGPTTLAAGSTATVTVNATPGISYVYLEQVHGILPKVKVPLTNGVGTFNVVTTGMSAGDQIEVKAGYKKWTNASTYTLTLS
jgi:hypothetical protein